MLRMDAVQVFKEAPELFGGFDKIGIHSRTMFR